MTRLKLATTDTFRSMRSRNFRLFFTGQLISQVGNWLTLVAQTLLVYKLTHSGVALGLLAAAQFGPVLVIGAFAGLAADRSDKRKLLLIVQSLAMFQSFALAAIAFMHHPPVAAIFAIAAFGGIATAFDNPARRSFVVEMVPKEDINNAVGLNSALMTGSRVIGPAIAGLLISTVGYGWCFLLDGVTYTAVIIGYFMMNTTELRRAPAQERGRGQIREGLRYVKSVPELWIPLAMMSVIGTLAFNFQTVLPLFVARDMHGSTVTFTWLLSVVSLGSLVGALRTARRSSISVRTVSLAAIGFGASMTAIALSPNLTVAFIFGIALGLTSIGFMTSSTSIVQTEADPSMRGRVLALQAMVFLGSTPIGGPIVGYIGQHFGARYSLGVGAAGCFVAGAFGLAQQQGKRLKRPPIISAAAPEIAAQI